MAGGKVRVVYDDLDEMTATFRRGADQLEQTMGEMKSIAEALTGGEALLGRGGEAFNDAILNKLCPAIERLEQKFLELGEDVQYAKNEMIASDNESRRVHSD